MDSFNKINSSGFKLLNRKEYKSFNINIEDFEKHYKTVLILIYFNLQKTKLSCFTKDTLSDINSQIVWDDIIDSLEINHQIYNAIKSIINDNFSEKTSSDESVSIVSINWGTFKNVFQICQLHPWLREKYPSFTAKCIRSTLFLDLLPNNKIEVSDLLNILFILNNGGESQHHFLRLLFWNLGIWELDLSESEASWKDEIEFHIDSLIDNPYQPFNDPISCNDLTYGYISPITLANMFFHSAKYAISTKEGKKITRKTPYLKNSDFETIQTDDDDDEKHSFFESNFKHPQTKEFIDNMKKELATIKNPYFLATFTRFTTIFRDRPYYILLHKIQAYIDDGMWENNMMWEYLIEYACAKFTNYENFETYVYKILECKDLVENISEEECSKARIILKDKHGENEKHSLKLERTESNIEYLKDRNLLSSFEERTDSDEDESLNDSLEEEYISEYEDYKKKDITNSQKKSISSSESQSLSDNSYN